MDDNQSSTTTEVGENRKRRSSILKQHRAPRAPFSELEFNVITPTDTAKSRRVSFSRRTGVAEFATNEATTTWKNFYEEQNKTLESSGNESEVNPPRNSVGHISKALFDQHFQDVEEIDLDVDLDKVSSTTTVKTLQFNDQRNIDMSVLPDQQSRVFGDVLCVSEVGEVTDRININFSDIQPITQMQGEINDDLDEIEKDLKKCSDDDQRQQSIGLFDGKDDSEYLVLDFNTTNVGLKTEESDMSITDTIHNSKVQAVPNAMSSEKKFNQDKDWVADKENILIVNPYVAPKESLNFAINKEPDKVLVFDGKRLTIQEDESRGNEEDYRGTLLPNSVPDRTPVARKTIVLNVNDDLPNVSATANMMVKGINVNQTVYNSSDVSITEAIPTNLEHIDKKTIVYENDACDLSITGAVPAKVILPKIDIRNTLIYESDSREISMTEALSSNIILSTQENMPQRRQTINYEDNECNISMTEAVRGNLVFTNEETEQKAIETDISITRCMPTNIILSAKNNSVISPNKQLQTIVYDEVNSDISVTQHVSTNIVATESRGISQTQATMCEFDKICTKVSDNETCTMDDYTLNIEKGKSDKRQTIVCEKESGDVSITLAVPSNLILPEKQISIVYDNKTLNICSNVSFNTEEKLEKTIIYEDETDSISVKKALHTSIFLTENNNKNSAPGYVYNLNTSSLVFGNPDPFWTNQAKSTIHRNTDNFCNAGSQYDHISILEMTNSNSRNTSIDKSKILKEKSDIDSEVQTNNATYDEKSIQSEHIFHKSEDLQTANCDVTTDISEKSSTTKDTTNCIEPSNMKQDILVYQTDIHRNNKNNALVVKDNCGTHVEAQNENHIKQKTAVPSLESVNNINSLGNPTTSDNEVKEDFKKSVLNDLLDMSTASEEDTSLSAKGITNIVNLMDLSKVVVDHPENETDTPKVLEPEPEKILKLPEIIEPETIKPAEITAPIPTNEPDIKKLMSKEHMTEENVKIDNEEIRTGLESNKVISNELKFNENNIIIVHQSASKLGKELEDLKRRKHENMKKYDSSLCRTQELIDANTTKDLLKLLSHFTDSETSSTENIQNKKEEKSVAEDKGVTCDIGRKIDMYERRRASYVARQSIVLSRENLLQNISMAREALCSTESSTPEHESEDDSSSDPAVDEEHLKSPKKSVGLSVDVVKQLKFDDSVSDCSSESNKYTPLKKNAYIDNDLRVRDLKNHDKAHVIPTYLKDVTDDIKNLMTDLVKPLHDVPFENTKNTQNKTSTCSLQIQANSESSSQVGLNEQFGHFLKGDESMEDIDAKEKESVVNNDNSNNQRVHNINPRPCASNVVQFDPTNPLNNILIPINFSSSKRESTKNDGKNDSNAYRFLNDSQNYLAITTFEAKTKPAVSYSLISGMSSSESSILVTKKPMVEYCKTKTDSEANTTLSMVPNKTLLELHSSLTVANENFDMDTKPQSPLKAKISLNNKKRVHSPSPIKVKRSNIPCLDSPAKPARKIRKSVSLENASVELDEESSGSQSRTKHQKCSKKDHDQRSPTNKSVLTQEPCPVLESKLPSTQQNESLIPITNKLQNHTDLSPEKMLTLNVHSMSPEQVKCKSPPHPKSFLNNKSPSPDQKSSKKEKRNSLLSDEALKKGWTEDSLFIKQEDGKIIKSIGSADEPWSECEVTDDDMAHEPHNSTGARPIHTETDQQRQRELINANILHEISKMPFVQSREVVWEKMSSDTWVFTLCERQLVMKVRLAEEPVTHCTPVSSTVVDVDCDTKDTVSSLGLVYAAKSVRYYASVRCARAGDVPSLLRRAVSVTRVALKWTHAMNVAHLYLAYDITDDGHLTLKVANLPLRSVWRMSMRLKMIVNAAHDMPVPAATDVRVEAAMKPCEPVSHDDVRRATADVKRDWRHVPRTLWKLFKFLKNKRGDTT